MKKIVTYSVLSFMGTLSLLGASSPTFASGYRVLHPQGEWIEQELAPTVPFCSVLKEYETGNMTYLSLQDDIIAAIFEIPHLNLMPGQQYKVKLESDDASLHRAQYSNLEGHHIKVPLGTLSEYRARLEGAESFKLSIGLNGMMFSSIDVKSGIKLLQTCLDGKVKVSPVIEDKIINDPDVPTVAYAEENIVPKNPAMAFEKSVKDSLEDSPLVVIEPLAEDLSIQNSLVDEPSISPDTPSELLSAAAELSRAASIDVVEHVPIEILPFPEVPSLDNIPELAQPDPQILLETIEADPEELIEHLGVREVVQDSAPIESVSLPKPETVIEADVAHPSLDELRAALPRNVLPRTNSVFSQKKRAPLEDEERALFESMKTKMLLLEKEKEAVRKRLTDLRQKEIDVMRVDINSLRQIEEMAAKIEILEKKIEQKNIDKAVSAVKSINPIEGALDDAVVPSDETRVD